MALFQLDPASIAARARGGAVPTLGQSVWRGVWGFTLLSMAGFAPWPIMDRWFRGLGEMHLYIACTVIFIGLSGVLLHRLILGAGSRWRFYAVFAVAFLGYAMIWVGLWMWLREEVELEWCEFMALEGAIVVMAGLLALAFDAWGSLAVIFAALFLCQAAGYYAGRWFEGQLGVNHRLLAIGIWALCYGLGFGAGLGAAFHFCQREARRILRGP